MGESSKLSHHLESYWGSGEEKLQNKHMGDNAGGKPPEPSFSSSSIITGGISNDYSRWKKTKKVKKQGMQ